MFVGSFFLSYEQRRGKAAKTSRHAVSLSSPPSRTAPRLCNNRCHPRTAGTKPRPHRRAWLRRGRRHPPEGGSLPRPPPAPARRCSPIPGPEEAGGRGDGPDVLTVGTGGGGPRRPKAAWRLVAAGAAAAGGEAGGNRGAAGRLHRSHRRRPQGRAGGRAAGARRRPGT